MGSRFLDLFAGTGAVGMRLCPGAELVFSSIWTPLRHCIERNWAGRFRIGECIGKRPGARLG